MTVLKINIPKRTVDVDEVTVDEEKTKAISWFRYLINSLKMDCIFLKKTAVSNAEQKTTEVLQV
jgi:hypothetical protein